MLRKSLIGGLCLSLVAVLSFSALIAAAPNDTRVADASKRGDLETVRNLLKQGVDVNSALGDGMTALHWAAEKGYAELAEMLLYAGANVKATTRIGSITPLALAAKNGNGDVVEKLLKSGADARTPGPAGVTPLMLGATSGDAETVHLLLDAGADPNAKEETHGQTALMFAAAFNRPAAIKTLLDHGADASVITKIEIPQPRGFGGGGGGAAAAAAATAGRGGQAAGQPGAPAAAQGQRGQGAPAAAAQAGAGRPAQPQQQQQGNDEERVVEADAEGGMTSLLYAARQGSLEAAKALLDGGAGINEASADNSTPLLIASINGHFDLAMELLNRGADPKVASKAGATPLYGAVNVQWAPKALYPQPSTRQERVTHIELMKALLEKGADPNVRLAKELWYTGYNFGLNSADTGGSTAFWRAAQVGDVEAMRLLVENGADPHIPSKDRITPLSALAGAGFHGNDEVVVPSGRMPAMRYLVDELKADVNLPDTGRGLSPLHNAAARGDNEMLLYLVSHGAKVDAVTTNGQTVADMANGPRQRIQPFPETIAILVSLGAKNSNKCVSC